MGIKELIGVEADRKVRYAIVGLGDIAQEDMTPGFDHAGNSEITALVTSDAVKADDLGKKYGVDAVFSYDQFDQALSSGTFDAIYLATLNWRHAEFIIPGLKAGYMCSRRSHSMFRPQSTRRFLTSRWHLSQTHGRL